MVIISQFCVEYLFLLLRLVQEHFCYICILYIHFSEYTFLKYLFHLYSEHTITTSFKEALKKKKGLLRNAL
ncbi:hypothetical protein RIF29_08519 [Crotalaria pallida]|uniref:Uncharacterized protein n=1 Tax=Crotalaria pallida TaxID=3830 RepID=A0AAN9FQW9_CROPI